MHCLTRLRSCSRRQRKFNRKRAEINRIKNRGREWGALERTGHVFTCVSSSGTGRDLFTENPNANPDGIMAVAILGKTRVRPRLEKNATPFRLVQKGQNAVTMVHSGERTSHVRTTVQPYSEYCSDSVSFNHVYREGPFQFSSRVRKIVIDEARRRRSRALFCRQNAKKTREEKERVFALKKTSGSTFFVH